MSGSDSPFSDHEFVDDLEAVLGEACRVARSGLLVGALNRRSLLGRELRRRAEPPWPLARLCSVGELKNHILRAAHENRPRLRWRTTLWPGWWRSLPLPWGGFIGISATWR